MKDLLSKGDVWLSKKRHALMTSPVQYVAGATTLDVRATIGTNRAEQDLDQELVNTVRERDYLIRAEDLVSGGTPIVPVPGHKIKQTHGDTEYTFEVTSRSGEPCWTWSDQERTVRRIHTKQVGSAAA